MSPEEIICECQNGAMMIAESMLSFREASSKERSIVDEPSFKRAQGRPARGETEVGSQKIVEGMRSALRSLGHTNVNRKDIAQYAGVTPALVTYYFAERDALIKAASLPIVEALVNDVNACLSKTGTLRQQLLSAIEVLLECYEHDAVIIEMFKLHKKKLVDVDVPDLLEELDKALTAFFERWIEATSCGYDATFLQKATIGMCKSAASLLKVKSGLDMSNHPERLGVAEMVCSILLRPDVDAEKSPVPN